MMLSKIAATGMVTLLLSATGLVGCSRSPDERSGAASHPVAKTLSVLAWVGYEEDEVRKPFEEEFGVQLKFDTFTGGDRMFSKLSQAPSLYDVVVVDPEYISKLQTAGLIQPLRASDYDFSDYLDRFQKFPLCWIDNQLWAVLVRYGTNGIVYNTKYVSEEDARSLSVLRSTTVTGKVGLWDWYLPTMGVLSLAMGNAPEPYRISREKLQELEESMRTLKPQVAGILDSLSAVSGALANEDFYLVPAVGEHAAAVLAEEGHPVSWSVPKEGAIMWIETLAIPSKAPNPDLAQKYIQYMMRPETQAKMAWRRAYRSGVPSKKALDHLSETQRSALHTPSVEAAQQLVGSLYVRELPTFPDGTSAEAEWQQVWSRFKAR